MRTPRRRSRLHGVARGFKFVFVELLPERITHSSQAPSPPPEDLREGRAASGHIGPLMAFQPTGSFGSRDARARLKHVSRLEGQRRGGPSILSILLLRRVYLIL